MWFCPRGFQALHQLLGDIVCGVQEKGEVMPFWAGDSSQWGKFVRLKWDVKTVVFESGT